MGVFLLEDRASFVDGLLFRSILDIGPVFSESRGAVTVIRAPHTPLISSTYVQQNQSNMTDCRNLWAKLHRRFSGIA